MKIRVLEVLASLKRAGAERMAVTLAQRLDPDRFAPAVVSLYDPFPEGFEPVLERSAIPMWHLGKRRGFDPRMYSRLLAVLRSFRPDVIHTHSYVLRYGWPTVARHGSGRMVHTVHNLATREVDRVGRWMQRFAFRGRVAAVAVAQEVARSFEAYYGVPPAAVIPNGIDVASFHRPDARAAWRHAHGFDDQDFLVVSVARLEPQKNPLGLVDGFVEGLGGFPHAHLILAGQGSLEPAVRQKIETLRFAHRIHCLGVQSGIPELLSAADVFALFSSYEGNPVAVMEALAAGVPVVAPAVGGIPELVVQDAVGTLVNAGDRVGFAAALACLAQQPERRRAMSEAARLHARQFDSERMVASYAGLFQRLVEKQQ